MVNEDVFHISSVSDDIMCIYTVEYDLLLDMLIEMMKVIFDCICNVYIENMNE